MNTKNYLKNNGTWFTVSMAIGAIILVYVTLKIK